MIHSPNQRAAYAVGHVLGLFVPHGWRRGLVSGIREKLENTRSKHWCCDRLISNWIEA